MRRLVALSTLALVASWPAVAGADDTISVTDPVVTGEVINFTVSVTMPDPNDPKKTVPVAGKWIDVANNGVGRTRIGQTDSNGKIEVHGYVGEFAQTKEALAPKEIDCPPAVKKDPGGTLSYNAATHTLSYNNGSVSEISYTDMTTTTVNTPTETMIGAHITITGLHFTGFNSFGSATFSNGVFTISDAQGDFVTGIYENARVATSGDGTSLLLGDTTDLSLNLARNSLFLSEFATDLATFPHNPEFLLSTDGNLGTDTGGYLSNGSENVTDCPYNVVGPYILPEPSSVALLGGGLALGLVLLRRRRAAA